MCCCCCCVCKTGGLCFIDCFEEMRTGESEDLEVFTIGELIVIFAKEPREHLLCFHAGSN